MARRSSIRVPATSPRWASSRCQKACPSRKVQLAPGMRGASSSASSTLRPRERRSIPSSASGVTPPRESSRLPPSRRRTSSSLAGAGRRTRWAAPPREVPVVEFAQPTGTARPECSAAAPRLGLLEPRATGPSSAPPSTRSCGSRRVTSRWSSSADRPRSAGSWCPSAAARTRSWHFDSPMPWPATTRGSAKGCT